MKKAVLFLLAMSFISVSAEAQISKQNLKDIIYYLASDKMEGRQTGTEENYQASLYITRKFKKFNLEPKGTQGYRQKFTVHITEVEVKDSVRTASNIIGFLDNGAHKTIVIGAHYDHIGRGRLGNSHDKESNIGKIHNGADDNASGVAGLLELARHYGTNNVKERYNILFIAFGAEELGLCGSKYFVDHPTIPLKSIHWMLNMDMIGRYNPERRLAIIGYGTSPAFETIFEGVIADVDFYLSHNGRGGSDQTSFYDKDIPVLFFHTGGHPDYHRHGDDPDKINYEALQSILELEIKVIDNSMKIDEMEFVWTN